MSYKQYFVTRKLYNGNEEKISIKTGYLPNIQKVMRAKRMKKIRQKMELESITPKGQLDLNSMQEFEKKKAEYDRKYAPKLENAVRSMNRAKNNLIDILRCNDFNFFVTLTFNNNNKDRLDDKQTRKLFTNWLTNLVRKLPNLYYVAVPEYHKKGGLHFHLLIGGVTAEDMKLKDSGKRVKSGRCKGQIIYNVERWDEKKKGFSTATEILDTNAVKFYLSKYLTKGKVDTRFFNKKRFYVSRNIKRPQVEKCSFPCTDTFNIYDSISKEDFNIEYEDLQKEYCVLSRQLKGV